MNPLPLYSASFEGSTGADNLLIYFGFSVAFNALYMLYQYGDFYG